MKKTLARFWSEEDGVVSFEWVLLTTLLTIGVVSGISAARDGIIDEFGDVAQAMLALDHSFTIDYPLVVSVHTPDGSTASNSSFVDFAVFTDCDRADGAPAITPVNQTLTAPQISNDSDGQG